MDINDNPIQYSACPECGMLTFFHDKNKRHHVCISEECGYVEDDGEESILMKLLKLLRLKKK
jgi:hypothetical protein